MADRYWVGGTGNWTDTARWSTSSGGASGASAPTATDNAFFDGNSGGGTASLPNQSCANLTATGYTGTLSGTINVKGDCVLGSGGTYSAVQLKLNGSGAQSLTSNGKAVQHLYIEGDASSERTVTFEDAASATGIGYGNLWLNYNAGAAVTLKLKDGVTHTFNTVAMATGAPSSGTNALQSTTVGAAATLADANAGSNSLYYVYISDIAATGGTFTGGTNAYDAGGNSGFSGLASIGGAGLFVLEVA